MEFNNGRKFGGQQLDVVQDNCRNPGESDPLTRIDFTGKVRWREDLFSSQFGHFKNRGIIDKNNSMGVSLQSCCSGKP